MEYLTAFALLALYALSQLAAWYLQHRAEHRNGWKVKLTDTPPRMAKGNTSNVPRIR